MAIESQSLITVHVVGVGDLGVFDKKTGGDTQAPTAKHRPGGMGPEKAYRTLPTYSDITVSRVLERDRDWELVRTLKGKAGNAMMTITEQPLDDDGNAWGSPQTYQGRLTNVKPGQVDSTSQNVRMFEIDCSVQTIS